MFDHPFGGQFGREEPNDAESGLTGNLPEAQRILQGLLAELPDEAHTLVSKVNRESAKLQEQVALEAAQIREKAEQEIAEVERKAERRRKALFEHALEQLEPLQKDLFRAGELGKALATFVQIQALRSRAENVMPDPGTLLRFEQVGKAYHFRITGHNQGAVWGTDTYTSDSHLATAAVHAGAVELGEEGVVRVTLVDLSGQPINGSFRNGIMSMDWGPYRVGYRIVRA